MTEAAPAQPPSAAPSALYREVLHDECARYELSLEELLNLCFEVSGYPAGLYTARDYESAVESECLEIVDSSLERASGAIIPAVSPLMSSLVRFIKLNFIDQQLETCYKVTMTDLLADFDYTPTANEFVPLHARGKAAADKIIKTAARLGEVCMRSNVQIDAVFAGSGSSKNLPFQKLVAGFRQVLTQVFSSGQINSKMAQVFRSWLVLFGTANIQVLRVTGLYALRVMTDLAISRVEELLALMGAKLHGNRRRNSAEAAELENLAAELDLSLDFLLTTAFATFKDRVADVNPIIAVLALEGCLALSVLDYDQFLDVATHVAIRHPSPVLRALTVDCIRRFVIQLSTNALRQKLVAFRGEFRDHQAYKRTQRLLDEVESTEEAREARAVNTIDVVLPILTSHTADTAFLVAWSCGQLLRTLLEMEKSGSLIFKDRQVTNIVSLVFSSNTRLPILPLLAEFIDRIVFAHTIVERSGSATIGPDVVYSTLIQFLTEYADDAQWIPHHLNAVKAFYPLSPHVRSFERIWEFLNLVYRPTGLSDTAQQYDWLAKPKTSDALLFLVQSVWECKEIVAKRAALLTADTLPSNLPSLFGADVAAELDASGSLVLGWRCNLHDIPWNSASAFLPLPFLEQLLNVDMPNLLQRAQHEEPQLIKILSILRNALSMLRAVEAGYSQSGVSIAYRARVQTVQEHVQRFVQERDKFRNPLVLHCALSCLREICCDAGAPSMSASRPYYAIYSRYFVDTMQACQEILKKCTRREDVVSASAQGSPRSNHLENIAQIMSVESIDRDELRCLLVRLRVFIYNDTNNLISDKLEFIDDLLNYVERASALSAEQLLADMGRQSAVFDLSLIVNALDLLWLTQAKFVERLTHKFNFKILPVVGSQSGKELSYLSIGLTRSMPSEAAPFTTAQDRQLVDVLRSFNEDLEIYKEMSLQISCYLAHSAEQCRLLLMSQKAGRYDTSSTSKAKRASRLSAEALLCALQCCRLLSANSIFQTGTKLWSHIRTALQTLRTENSQIELLRQSIGKHALACFMPAQNGMTVEVAYFIDGMKQVYAQRRREVEHWFSTHQYTQYGLLLQHVGHSSPPVGPLEFWDVYKNRLSESEVNAYCESLDLELLAFAAQAQLTSTLCKIPDKTLWKDSLVGPVILAYFRSKTPVMQTLATEFMEKCFALDEVAAAQTDDVTDRPLLCLLMLNTLQTLLKRALDNDNQEKIRDVTRLAVAFAEHLPKDYWRNMSDMLFMNFVWMTIQKACACDPRGYLLEVVVEGLVQPVEKRLPKRYSKTAANTQIDALRELAREWHTTNPTISVQKSFFARLLRFLRICLPTASFDGEEPFAESWPAPVTA